MKITSAEFIISAPALGQCPPAHRPEFALIGRSNVGKSSLINSLVGRKGLARVSEVPGKTQLINFFEINQAWRLVDLPGYGYAKVAKTQRHSFNVAVHDYLKERQNLRCVFVLIDANVPPQEVDLDFLRWLAETEKPFVLVFTKTDKLSQPKLEASRHAFTKAIEGWWGDEAPDLLNYSSRTGTGRSQLLQVIQGCLKN